MIKDALEYIVGMKKPNITEIGGQTYSDKKLERISYEPHIEPFKLSTLDSLIKYIKSDLEVPVTPFFLHIVSEKSVKMLESDLITYWTLPTPCEEFDEMEVSI